MKTKSLAIVATVGTFAVLALLFAYPAMAAVSAHQNSDIQQTTQLSQNGTAAQEARLSVDQTLTLTSVAGGYREIGTSTNGTATGSLTLKVTGVFAGGYALSLTGGAITVNGNTYTISSGSAELGRYGVRMAGQGQAGSAKFLFAARNLGGFGGSDYGVLRVDLTSGSQEFGLRLLVTVSK